MSVKNSPKYDDVLEHKTLTGEEWEKFVAIGDYTDISHELPDSFLYIGQWMRAKIKHYGKKWYVSGWWIDNKPIVTMTEVKQ